MEMVLPIAEKVCTMFFWVALGALCGKKGLLTEPVARMLCNFHLTVILPGSLIQTFQIERQPGMLKSFGIALILSALTHLICIYATNPFYRGEQSPRRRVERYAMIFANSGFMGIPLLIAAVGRESTFYAAAYLIFFNLFSWSTGVVILQGGGKVRLFNILLSPGVLGTMTGFFLFFFQVPLPLPLRDAIAGIDAMNTPFSMLLIGVFIAFLSWRETFFRLRNYLISLCRDVILPLGYLLLVGLLQVRSWQPLYQDVAFAIFICGCCPAGVSTMMMPTKYGGDAGYGAQLVACSTLLSLVTIPAMALLGKLVIYP